jgi:phosphoglycerate dehydrogenase-like enzyme
MKPKLLLLDEPCDKAKEIFEQEFDCSNEWKLPDMVYTGLTPTISCTPVVCPCTGTDHIKAKKIIHLDDEWKCGEGKYVTSTAEHTWSLILQLAKLKRMQLSGKTIAVVGVGRVGRLVASIGYRLCGNVLYCDILETRSWAFAEILKQSNIITLHVPLNESTKGMIGKEQFARMKPGALLINTSRPDIVELNALIENLNNGHLGGYADDFANDRVIPCINIIQTPHIAGNCIEAREATDIYVATKTIEWWRSQNP